MTSIALMLTSFAYAACDGDVSNADLKNHLTAAQSAYEQLDLARFRSNRDAAMNGVPCMIEPLTPTIAADLHRLEGLIAFSDRDTSLAESSFAAARDLEPEYSFPATMVPAGNPILIHYGAVNLAKVPMLPVVPPAEGMVWLNGEPATGRREGLPLFFQRTDPEGTVTTSQLLPPGATLPTYPKAPIKVQRSGWRRSDLHIAAVGLGVATLSTIGAAGIKSSVCTGPLLLGACIPKSGVSRDKAGTANTVASLLSAAAISGVAVTGTFGTRARVRGAKTTDR